VRGGAVRAGNRRSGASDHLDLTGWPPMWRFSSISSETHCSCSCPRWS
jgi:hypothetical protein